MTNFINYKIFNFTKPHGQKIKFNRNKLASLRLYTAYGRVHFLLAKGINIATKVEQTIYTLPEGMSCWTIK